MNNRAMCFGFAMAAAVGFAATGHPQFAMTALIFAFLFLLITK